MNILKKKIKNDEDLWCDEENDDGIEDLKNCIRSLKFHKDKFFWRISTK